jgi:hypothetical protein
MDTLEKPSLTNNEDTNTLLPNRQALLLSLCEAIQDDGIEAEHVDNGIRMETAEAEFVRLELCDDLKTISLWTPIYLSTPKLPEDRWKALNQLNIDAGGVRFYQTTNDEFFDVAADHLIGAEGLTRSTLSRFIREFFWEVEHAEEFVEAEGFCDDAKKARESETDSYELISEEDR